MPRGKILIPLTAAASALSLSLFGAVGAHAATSTDSKNNMTSLDIIDGADVLNEQKIADVLSEVQFREPTDVAILSREGEYSDDINTETLNFAREQRPDWISADPEDYGDYWADGLFVITLSVEGPGDGQIGTYFGEDRKVSESQMESIHEAGYDDFNLSRWTDGVIAVADEAAGLMNRPWYLSPALWITALVAAGMALVGTLVNLSVRSSRRRQFAEHLQTGSEHLTNVSMDLEETELAARTLPTGSTHAANLEKRFADFMGDYRISFESQQGLQEAGKKLRSTARGVNEAKDFAQTAKKLDATDDAIIAAAALYTRSASWEDAWREQTAPILEDLGQLPALTASAEGAMKPAAQALDSFAFTAKDRLDRIGTELKMQSISVDDALDRLAEIRTDLTARLDALAEAQINEYAENEEEKEAMRDAMDEERARRPLGGGRGAGSILDVTSPANLFWRVQAYNLGYNAGVSQVDSSRASASSSGGISSGYSGGGSFSGSGGSSRF